MTMLQLIRKHTQRKGLNPRNSLSACFTVCQNAR